MYESPEKIARQMKHRKGQQEPSETRVTWIERPEQAQAWKALLARGVSVKETLAC